ncbi:hypothetical protein ACFE04_011703 [Oxalis oulophora]
MEDKRGTICVTGGSGFIASWIIKRLLEQGFSVNTTVRPDPPADHKRDLSFLTNLPGALEKLKIFTADLSDPPSFEPAIQGCSGVLHVATPVDFESKESVEAVTKRALEGTLGILNSCLKFKNTVKRIVYTSSASTVCFNGLNVDVMDESFWTDIDFVKSNFEFGQSYLISKTATEKAALQFAKEHGLDLVTLLPTFVIGPFICPKLPGSVQTSLGMVFGKEYEYPQLLNTSMVHVDDVARAHIFLLECSEPNGRYICSSHKLTIEEMATLLLAKYPEYPIPKPEMLKNVKGFKTPAVSSKKLLDGGFNYKYDVEDMFDDAIQCCKENGKSGHSSWALVRSLV